MQVRGPSHDLDQRPRDRPVRLREIAVRRRRRRAARSTSRVFTFSSSSTVNVVPLSPHVPTTRPSTSARRPEQPVGRHDLVRPDDGRATPTEQQRIERAEQPRRRQSRGLSRLARSTRPSATSDELRPDALDTGARVAERQPGPLREVARVGRTVAGEIPAREPRRARPVASSGSGAVAEPVGRPRRTRARRRASGRARSSPRSDAASSTCTSAWPAVGTPRGVEAARSSRAGLRPVRRTASVTTSTPRSACASLTPSWRSRRRLPRRSAAS